MRQYSWINLSLFLRDKTYSVDVLVMAFLSHLWNETPLHPIPRVWSWYCKGSYPTKCCLSSKDCKQRNKTIGVFCLSYDYLFIYCYLLLTVCIMGYCDPTVQPETDCPCPKTHLNRDGSLKVCIMEDKNEG